MPGGDRTGPMGAGPQTGRGAGFCAGFNVPGFANVLGFGFGGGRGAGRGGGMGMGRGRRNMFGMQGLPTNQPAVTQYPPMTEAPVETPAAPPAEVAELRQQLNVAMGMIQQLQQQLGKAGESTVEKSAQ